MQPITNTIGMEKRSTETDSPTAKPQTSRANEHNNARRFGGVARLYGDDGLTKLNAAHVCVIGIGGVGSWVAESLARSAIGQLTLIDMDVVSESNVNRQLVATTDTIGRDKGLVMAERIAQINEHCVVNVVDDFISQSNLADLLPLDSLNDRFDFVIDCIDDFRTKAALIHYCKTHKIKILTVGAAGGQIDPSKIAQSDLSRTQHDALLARTRKLLRQDYGFARNPKRSFGIPCVYSNEQAIYPDGLGGLSMQRPPQGSTLGMITNALNCAGGIGSATHVTGSFAFFATGYVLNELICDGS